MLRKALLFVILTGSAVTIYAQTAPTPKSSPRPNTSATPPPAARFDLTEYGVRLEADQRLIVVMAALDAAGFDPAPGKEPSAFRALLRKDLAGLDPDLRRRLREFFERNKRAGASPADEAARYVSLAYALSPAPALDEPERSEDLPAGVLEVLDFAPLVREFYKRSGIDERLPGYFRAYQAEGDRMRQPTADLVRDVLTYMYTRPVTTVTERSVVRSPDKKKNAKTAYTTKEHDRRFFIVPDLLAAPGAINFRVIADDYFMIVPEGTDPAASELRRGYIQYVVDALVLRGSKEIAARREQVKQLIDARIKEGATLSPDAFVVVTRSLVAAVDARFEESVRLAAVNRLQRTRLQTAKDEAARLAIAREAQAARAAITDETIARLAEDYENGAPLTIYMPLKPKHDYRKIASLAELLAGEVTARVPRIATIQRSLAKRGKQQVYVDAMQNARGKTIAAAFSARAKPGASVSMPLTWKQIEKGVKISDFTIKNVPKLVEKGDPWKGFFESSQVLKLN